MTSTPATPATPAHLTHAAALAHQADLRAEAQQYRLATAARRGSAARWPAAVAAALRDSVPLVFRHADLARTSRPAAARPCPSC